jgi:hypothetical protein
MIADCGVVPAKVTAQAAVPPPRQAPIRALSASPAWAKQSLSGAASRAAVDIKHRGRTGVVRRAVVPGRARFIPTGVVAAKNVNQMVSEQ